jgi:hypothetical protein
VFIVQPETVLRWHRRGFRAYWRWKSRPRGGRPRIPSEIRDLIRRMHAENPLWGAPRIHGELLMLGLTVSESTVSNYLAALPRRRPGQGWRTFWRIICARRLLSTSPLSRLSASNFSSSSSCSTWRVVGFYILGLLLTRQPRGLASSWSRHCRGNRMFAT